jgi:hypothetical protein
VPRQRPPGGSRPGGTPVANSFSHGSRPGPVTEDNPLAKQVNPTGAVVAAVFTGVLAPVLVAAATRALFPAAAPPAPPPRPRRPG